MGVKLLGALIKGIMLGVLFFVVVLMLMRAIGEPKPSTGAAQQHQQQHQQQRQ